MINAFFNFLKCNIHLRIISVLPIPHLRQFIYSSLKSLRKIKKKELTHFEKIMLREKKNSMLNLYFIVRKSFQQKIFQLCIQPYFKRKCWKLLHTFSNNIDNHILLNHCMFHVCIAEILKHLLKKFFYEKEVTGLVQ